VSLASIRAPGLFSVENPKYQEVATVLKDSKPKAGAECKVCLAPHDDEIHEATLRVRKWFRYQVNRSFLNESESAAPALVEPLPTKVA
jgi:hypothetical protein